PDARRLWAERRADRLTDEELCEVEVCLSRSSGHCMVMGTASTMAAMAETLGMTLPGNAAIPAPDSRRLALAELSGRRAVEMALAGGAKPSEILTAQAFDNAIHGDAPTVNGRTLVDNVRDARCWNEDVIRPLNVPLASEGGTVILSGNLCPDGAVLKQSAASPHLLTHRGRAVVFESHADLAKRI